MFTTRQFGRLTQERHRNRLLRATRIRWQQRALFVVGGIMVGAVAVAFAALADRAQRGFAELLTHGRWWPLIVTPLGLALASFVTNRYFSGSQGSGIPQVIAAHRLASTAARQRLVSLRVGIGKIMITVFGLLCGASTGREGPTVQIGAALMFAAGRLSPRKQSGLIVAGAAAGVAAAFNTPIAGIIFGIEELTRTFERRTSGLILATVVAAGSVSLVLVGNYTYFGTSTGTLHGSALWLGIPLCGVTGGLLGGAFARLVIGLAGANVLGGWARGRPTLVAAGCGLAVALVGLVAGDATYGTGYAQVRNALDGTAPLGLLFMPLKFLATIASSLSGIPGGIFSPSLAIGAGLGADVARLFPSADVGAIILLGMVAYLAGVVQAPITAFVIVTELTNDRAMLMPLMLTALIAYGTARLVCRDGIYHALARRFLAAEAPKPQAGPPAPPRRAG
ncbi:MAG TPA: chloride channel protein [Gammaproteobacteria bacterium]|jgi:H+/Cl- antiporter ClcA|nr:chloride channel protein [Gammaproteobacteria bacterium]